MVLSAETMCPQSQDKIHHIYHLPILRDLGQPPVGTYCSHFLTFSDMQTMVFNRNGLDKWKLDIMLKNWLSFYSLYMYYLFKEKLSFKTV